MQSLRQKFYRDPSLEDKYRARFGFLYLWERELIHPWMSILMNYLSIEHWGYGDTESDMFGIKVLEFKKDNTTRGVVSTICSVFNPLNLPAPVMFPEKQIM